MPYNSQLIVTPCHWMIKSMREPNYQTVSTIATRYGIRSASVYLWLNLGRIPEALTDRSGRVVRIDVHGFEELRREGVIMREPGRKPRPDALWMNSRRSRHDLLEVIADVASFQEMTCR
jgi:hypothetical protein